MYTHREYLLISAQIVTKDESPLIDGTQEKLYDYNKAQWSESIGHFTQVWLASGLQAAAARRLPDISTHDHQLQSMKTTGVQCEGAASICLGMSEAAC